MENDPLHDPIEELLRNLTRGTIQLPQHLSLSANGSRIVRGFREARALTPSSAQRFHAHTTFDEAAFAHLLNMGIVRRTSPARYYLDEKALRRLIMFPPE